MKECSVCKTKDNFLITMMGICKCKDCLRNELKEENYNPVTELKKASKFLKTKTSPE